MTKLRNNPALRQKDKVSDAINAMYDTPDGRASLTNLLMEHGGDFKAVDVKLNRAQETVHSSLAQPWLSLWLF